MPLRVALFLDCQNVYKCAREAFHGDAGPSSDGQVFPDAVGNLICSLPQPPGDRVLVEARAYLGRPSQSRDAKGYAASRRQIAAWESRGVKVFPRTLRYRPGLPPQEKGVDVTLAIDFVAGAVDRAFDVGIIFSTDTDLIPALEFVLARPALGVIPEVAAWWADGANAPLGVSGRSIWCHRLTRTHYERVRDRHGYAAR